MNKKEVDTVVEVTNFFAGADQKREEVLAQPEQVCSCGCTATCAGSPDPTSSWTNSQTMTVAQG